MTKELRKGMHYVQRDILRDLVSLQYARNDHAFVRGTFRVRGDVIEIWPAHLENRAWRMSFFGDELEQIFEIDPLNGQKMGQLNEVRIYANSHYVTPGPTLKQAIKLIRIELAEMIKRFESEGKLLEAQRLEQRTRFDLELLEATGICNGIENY